MVASLPCNVWKKLRYPPQIVNHIRGTILISFMWSSMLLSPSILNQFHFFSGVFQGTTYLSHLHGCLVDISIKIVKDILVSIPKIILEHKELLNIDNLLHKDLDDYVSYVLTLNLYDFNILYQSKGDNAYLPNLYLYSTQESSSILPMWHLYNDQNDLALQWLATIEDFSLRLMRVCNIMHHYAFLLVFVPSNFLNINHCRVWLHSFEHHFLFFFI